MDRRSFILDASAAAAFAAAGCSDKPSDATKVKQQKEGKGMDFKDLIEARRSVRQYAKAEISAGEMEAIVADALNAPSWRNSETTRYYAAIGEDAKKKMWDALPAFNVANSANASALVAVTYVPGESGFRDGTPTDDLGNTWGAYDCGLASSYFILAAKNRGWDTLIMGMRDVAKVKAVFGIPESQILMAVIAVGKAAQPPVKVPRKPVSEVLKTA